MAVTNFPKRITVASLGLATVQLEGVAEAGAGKAVSVVRVWGTVQGKEAGSGTFGPYLKFKGDFSALNLVNAEESRSALLLLPSIAESVVDSVFNQAAKEGGSAQIAIEITVTYRKPKTENDKGTRFVYGVKPLIEFKGDDALSIMAKQLPPPVFLKGIADKSSKK
jgi:hypothetical protein